ncbi:LIM/homeobox protein Lhx9-like [Planococcus citri]|uniref:LIM/homeobox protein Lhx9-like n=1 Tax=Planococcus citri TaxID=170843 RepID=UPI0031F913DF
MGVYEGLTQVKPGMHWQQHQDRHQMLFAAYDPSRDLSPNLPTTSCQDSITSLSAGSGAPSRSSSNSGCSTPNNNTTTTRIGMCCTFKEEYDQTEYPKIPSAGGCQDCGQHNNYPKDFNNHRAVCKTENDNSDYYDYKKPVTSNEYANQIESKSENPVGSPEDDILKMCAGCGRQISDRFYLYAVDRQWHASCLQCSQCSRTLDHEVTCFARDGNIYCRKDYQRLFSQNRCSRCKSTISSQELVMRAREYVFHLPCFFCVVCMTVLRKGDHFGMRDGEVYCRLHYELLPPHPADHNSPVPPPEDYSAAANRPGAFIPPAITPSSLQTLPSPDFQSQNHHNIISQQQPQTQPAQPPHSLPLSNDSENEKVTNTFYNGVSAPRPKGRPRKRKPKDIDGLGSGLDINSDSYLDMAFGGSGSHGLGGPNGSHHQRTKRMRTSFKHHQLRTMKTYFTVNHNPDAKDLKQLSQKTGLAKRVLQVWFQNARAKWRRMLNKQQENNGTSIKNMDDKSCSDNSSSALESVYHHGPMGMTNHSPQHYLSPASLDCNSS